MISLILTTHHMRLYACYNKVCHDRKFRHDTRVFILAACQIGTVSPTCLICIINAPGKYLAVSRQIDKCQCGRLILKCRVQDTHAFKGIRAHVEINGRLQQRPAAYIHPHTFLALSPSLPTPRQILRAGISMDYDNDKIILSFHSWFVTCSHRHWGFSGNILHDVEGVGSTIMFLVGFGCTTETIVTGLFTQVSLYKIWNVWFFSIFCQLVQGVVPHTPQTPCRYHMTDITVSFQALNLKKKHIVISCYVGKRSYQRKEGPLVAVWYFARISCQKYKTWKACSISVQPYYLFQC